MDKKKNWKDYLPSKRRLIQLYAALLYNANLAGFARGRIYGGALKNFCVPGLNCYSCPGAVGACPLGALQNALAVSSRRAPSYVIGILLLFGLLLGRTVCGFLCPVGMIQELLYKIPSKKVRKSRATRALSYLKYGILIAFVVAIPLIYMLKNVPVPGFCKYICPAGTLEGALALLAHPANRDMVGMLGALFTNKIVILCLFILAAVFIYRVFCRFLCPLGAIYGLFSKFALIGVETNADRCVGCGRCTAVCKMDVKYPGDHECIHCGECLSACPHQAIIWKKAPWRKTGAAVSERQACRSRSGLAVLLLVVLLGGVMGYVASERGAQPQPPVWEEAAGEAAADFTAPLYGGGEFTLSSERGKPVVLNFWATWCGPCIEELPYFEQIAAKYAGHLSVVAIHADLVTEDVDAFLETLNLNLTFAQDSDGSILTSFGGSMALPQTVVLDAKGQVVYNQVGAMTLDKLEDLIAPLVKS